MTMNTDSYDACWKCHTLGTIDGGETECSVCFGSGYLARGLFAGVKRVVRNERTGELEERWGE
jgi:RecJ-like exonuclease